jgi:hypothetical protein
VVYYFGNECGSKSRVGTAGTGTSQKENRPSPLQAVWSTFDALWPLQAKRHSLSQQSAGRNKQNEISTVTQQIAASAEAAQSKMRWRPINNSRPRLLTHSRFHGIARHAETFFWISSTFAFNSKVTSLAIPRDAVMTQYMDLLTHCRQNVLHLSRLVCYSP